MTDLIPRDAAIAMFEANENVPTQSVRSLLGTIPAIDPAAIREDALREAAELCDRYLYMGALKTSILALIREKK